MQNLKHAFNWYLITGAQWARAHKFLALIFELSKLIRGTHTF
jgi:hypothetical protein